jgi:hypothetical protein
VYNVQNVTRGVHVVFLPQCSINRYKKERTIVPCTPHSEYPVWAEGSRWLKKKIGNVNVGDKEGEQKVTLNQFKEV